MTSTPILGIEHVAAAQANKYLTINTALDMLESALLAGTDVDCTAGGTVNVTATELQEAGVLYLTGSPAGAFTLELASVDRTTIIVNQSGQTATIQSGAHTVTQSLANASVGLFIIGDSMIAVGGSGGTYTDELAQDAIAAAIAAGTHSGVTITYDDTSNAISFAVASNSDYQESVRIIATTNLTLNGEYTTQSVALVDGDRVGALGQTFAPDRRIWIVRAGADWDIADGWDVADTITTNAQVTADEGTYEGQTYRLTTTGTIVLGTTSLTWASSESAVAQYTNRNVNSASYTILSSDRNKWIYLGRSGNQAITLEEYAVQPMANGSQFVLQYYGGSGTKTITADAAVTLNGSAGGSVTLTSSIDAYLFKQKSKNVWVAVPWKAAATSYTQEQIEDFVAAMFAAGTHTNITVTYNDASGSLSLATSGSSYTTENAQDDLAAAFAAGTHTGITITYTDGSNKFDFVVSQEQIEDWAAALITGATHSGISVSYNDGSGTLAFTLSQETVEDYAAGIITAGTHDGISVSYNDGAGTLSFTAKPKECLIIACGDETTAPTAGTSKVTFRMPYAFTLTAVRASLTTAQSSGSLLTIDINESGTTILSTKLTIDNSEKTSTTAATAAVISDSSLADDAEMTIDFDAVGTGGAGVKVYLIGHRT